MVPQGSAQYQYKGVPHLHSTQCRSSGNRLLPMLEALLGPLTTALDQLGKPRAHYGSLLPCFFLHRPPDLSSPDVKYRNGGDRENTRTLSQIVPFPQKRGKNPSSPPSLTWPGSPSRCPVQSGASSAQYVGGYRKPPLSLKHRRKKMV